MQREELQTKAVDVQMLKFGKKIDLDHILSMSVNKTADELKKQLFAADEIRMEELARWQVCTEAESQRESGARGVFGDNGLHSS